MLAHEPRREILVQGSHRRWTVIASGLLLAALALIVTFTSRAAFFSPTAVAVVAAVGVMALMLQIRFRYPQQRGEIHLPSWFNLAGGILALSAFLCEWLHLRPAVIELITLAAIGSFGVSGALVLHKMRKRRSSSRSND
jgi:drug/metabolite transporter (DMT)-like permease